MLDFRIVQTVYNALGGVAAIAQYPNEVYASRLAATKIDEHFDVSYIVRNSKASSATSNHSTSITINKI